MQLYWAVARLESRGLLVRRRELFARYLLTGLFCLWDEKNDDSDWGTGGCGHTLSTGYHCHFPSFGWDYANSLWKSFPGWDEHQVQVQQDSKLEFLLICIAGCYFYSPPACSTSDIWCRSFDKYNIITGTKGKQNLQFKHSKKKKKKKARFWYHALFRKNRRHSWVAQVAEQGQSLSGSQVPAVERDRETLVSCNSWSREGTTFATFLSYCTRVDVDVFI